MTKTIEEIIAEYKESGQELRPETELIARIFYKLGKQAKAEEVKEKIEKYYDFVKMQSDEQQDENNIMIAYDMHSRKIACKHIINLLNT